MRARFVLWSSIRYNIILPYALVIVMLTSVGVFVVNHLVTGSFEERFKNQIKDAGRIVTAEILSQEELRLNISRQIINTIGMAEAVANQDWQTVHDFVQPTMATNDGIGQILIVDRQGQERRRFYREVFQPKVGQFNQDIDTGQNLATWSAVAQVLADSSGNTKSVTIAYDDLLQEYLTYTVAPLRTENGVGGAVLVGNYLRNELRRLKGVAAADILLLSQDGTLVPDLTTLPIRVEELATVSERLSADRYQEIVIKRETETFMDEMALGGKRYRLAYTPLILQGRVQGMLAIALSTDFVVETYMLSRNWLVLIFSLGILVLLVVGIFTAQRIINPLTHLVNITQAITKGDLKQRSGLQRNDEVGLLATNFDRMTAELERKNAELEEQAGRLTAILNSMADGVIVQDLSGQGVIQNPAFDALLERIQKGQLRQTTWQWKHDLHAELLRQTARLQPQQPHNIEIGQLTLNSIATPVLSSEQEPLGRVIVLRDITREIESERLKDKFISSTSHELRTPLVAIKGYNAFLNMMLRRIIKQVNEQEHQQIMEYFGRVEEQVGDLDTVVQSLLDLSQIDAQEFDLQLERLDLTVVIQAVVDEWADKMAQKGLEFQWRTASKPLWVHGDVERLQQLFQRLIKNAHDYTLVGHVHLHAEEKQGQIQVILEDSGVGVTAEDKRYLFTRFFRALHHESTYGIAGAGLGLYISQAIIEQHQGKIVMESEAYNGSTVYVTLPLATPADDEDTHEAQLAANI